jgi:hypothetical protein
MEHMPITAANSAVPVKVLAGYSNSAITKTGEAGGKYTAVTDSQALATHRDTAEEIGHIKDCYSSPFEL